MYELKIFDNDLPNWKFEDNYDDFDELQTRISSVLQHHKDSSYIAVTIAKKEKT